jgi:signal transduction histidine kinase
LIGYAVARLADEQRKQNSRLEEANRQLASYASTLEQLTISRERNRLARELHDTLAHTLSGLAVQLEAVEALWDAEPEKSHHILQDSLSQTRSGLKEARRAIQALRAAPLEDLGLRLALEALAQSEADRRGLALDLQLPDRLPELRPEVEHGIYRITEEALRNAAQHAQASKLAVRVSEKNGRLELLIQDNGRGFDPAQPPPADRFGLRGMQERAAAIGGQIKLTSQPGAGTSIILWVEADT